MKKFFFLTPETSAITLMTLLLDKYGTEFLKWDPVTIRDQIERDMAIKLHPLTDNKIQAAATVMTTDVYHHSLEAFNNINIALSGEPVDTSAFFVPSDMEDILIGTLEVMLMEGADESVFSDNIRRYVGFMLNMYGLVKPPETLSWAEMPIDTGELDDFIMSNPTMLKSYWKEKQEEKVKTEKALADHIRVILQELDQLPDTMINKSYVRDSLRKVTTGNRPL